MAEYLLKYVLDTLSGQVFQYRTKTILDLNENGSKIEDAQKGVNKMSKNVAQLEFVTKTEAGRA